MARRRGEELLAEALRLPIKQRARVAHELLASLDEAEHEDPAAVARAWHDEIARRLKQIEQGEAKLVTWASAKRQILRSLSTRSRRRTRSQRTH